MMEFKREFEAYLGYDSGTVTSNDPALFSRQMSGTLSSR